MTDPARPSVDDAGRDWYSDAAAEAASADRSSANPTPPVQPTAVGGESPPGSPAPQPSPSAYPESAYHAGPDADGDSGSEHRSFLAELPFLVLVAFVLALLLKTFLVQAFFIPSSSMEPTLDIGDRVLVNKVVYHLREPRRGEIVVFSEDDAGFAHQDPNPVRRFLRSLASGLGLVQPGEKDFIKRIIGLPGDVIEMRDGVVTINGEPLSEAPTTEGGYLSTPDLAPFGPFEVPPGHYFMMGDNRPNSADSRTALGPVPEEQIVGRAFVVIWPVGRLKGLSRPDYAASALAAAWTTNALVRPVAAPLHVGG